VIAHPDPNAAVNLVGVALDDRPSYFETLFARLLDMRRRSGRPHWILVDEAHHLVPLDRPRAEQILPRELQGVIWVTVNPEHLAAAAVRCATHVVALGDDPDATLRAVAAPLGRPPPQHHGTALARGQALLWRAGSSESMLFEILPTRSERRRHVRKYAEGDLGEDRSFYFRGPEGKMRLRASNLMSFLELAEGVDDDTWLHHLQSGHYSRWFRECIKDPELAEAAARAERESDSAASRRLLRDAIRTRYTLPA
jgi:hypothetical protein